MFLLEQSVQLVTTALKVQVWQFRALQDITVTLLDCPQLLGSVVLVTTVMDHHQCPILLVPHMETFVHQVFIALRGLLLLYIVQLEHSLLVHLTHMLITVYSVLVDSIALHLDSLHQMVSVVKEYTVLQDRTALKEYRVQ